MTKIPLIRNTEPESMKIPMDEWYVASRYHTVYNGDSAMDIEADIRGSGSGGRPGNRLSVRGW